MSMKETADRIRALGQSLADERDRVAMLTVAQILERMTGSLGFSVTVIVSHRTGQGMLDVVWGGQPVQINATKAREIAWLLLESASTAEAEATLCGFLQAELRATPDHAAIMLRAFREHRAAHPPDSLLVDDPLKRH